MSTPSLPDDLRARILAKAAATPAPSRTRTNVRLLALVATAAVWMVLLVVLHGRRADWATEPAWMIGVPLIDALLAAVVVTNLAVSKGKTMLGAPVAWLVAAMVLAPVVTGTVAVVSVLGALGNSAWLTPAMELRTSIGCDVFALVLALPLLGLFVLSLRGRALASPALVGAIGGVCVGSWSHAALTFICPWSDPVHLVVGHVLPAIPMALLGAWVVRAVSRRANRVTLRVRLPAPGR